MAHSNLGSDHKRSYPKLLDRLLDCDSLRGGAPIVHTHTHMITLDQTLNTLITLDQTLNTLITLDQTLNTLITLDQTLNTESGTG